MKARTPMFTAALVAVSLMLPGYALAQNYADSVKQLVSTAKKQVPTLNMDQFKAAFDKKELGLIVDVRNPDEYADGFIPGAVNVPRGLIEFTIWTHVGFPDKTDMSTSVFSPTCAAGRRPRSSLPKIYSPSGWSLWSSSSPRCCSAAGTSSCSGGRCRS